MEELHFKNLDINIKKGDLINIIGPNGCGKTTLLKTISGRLNIDNIFIDDKSIESYSLEYKRMNIVCVFDDDIFNTDNVCDELRYFLNILKINVDVISERIKYFIDYFDLNNLYSVYFNELSLEVKKYVKILSFLIINPELLCIDDLLTYLSNDKKIRILNYIKDNNITFLNVTSNMEELILLDKILIINKGRKELFDDTEVILNNEEVFKQLGISLPFIYDINNMLKSYDLISNNHIIYKELVDMLWK